MIVIKSFTKPITIELSYSLEKRQILNLWPRWHLLHEGTGQREVLAEAPHNSGAEETRPAVLVPRARTSADGHCLCRLRTSALLPSRNRPHRSVLRLPLRRLCANNRPPPTSTEHRNDAADREDDRGGNRACKCRASPARTRVPRLLDHRAQGGRALGPVGQCGLYPLVREVGFQLAGAALLTPWDWRAL